VQLSWFWITIQAPEAPFRQNIVLSVWGRKVGVIEDIEDLGAELDVEALQNSLDGMFLKSEKSNEATRANQILRPHFRGD